MYKLLLCWKYLLTRFLALACIVSVMLGVATLIVVNSVMAGFSTKLRDRLHGLLSDIVVEAPDFDGFSDAEGRIAAIRNDPFLNSRIAAMTPTLEVFAMLHYHINGMPLTRPVKLIGIDPEGRASVGGFAEYLWSKENRTKPSFDLSPEAEQRFRANHWATPQPSLMDPRSEAPLMGHPPEEILVTTSNPLDLAIEGNGYFRFRLPNGETRYTRHGALHLDKDGKLVNANDFFLEPQITAPADTLTLRIERDGTVLCQTVAAARNSTVLGQLQLASFPNPDGLAMDKNGLLYETETSGAAKVAAPAQGGVGIIYSGVLEKSNELPRPWEPGGLAVPTKPPPEPPTVQQFKPIGIYLGWAISHGRVNSGPGVVEEKRFIELGDDVQLTTVKFPTMAPETRRFVVADYIKTEMSEYDSNFVFMPLNELQQLRNLDGRATSIQIRLKHERDAPAVVKRLNEMFGMYGLHAETWEDKQGPLLAAISVEKGILNVLLFMIIGVAGFGILAIFSMIVVEKTRDIGILKALGASNLGVMNIFLGYGLLLGIVGAAMGTALGITITVYINQIHTWLGKVTGTPIFNPQIYYFKDIPVDLQPMTVLLVNVGAVGIAVLFSVLPALRAALLHPVRALRYE